MTNEPAKFAASAALPEIPGYRIESVLGRGATGTVYRAVQLAVDREVAIKVLHPEHAGSNAVRRLQREARTTARLAHPGIVSAIDMGQVNGMWWYAMELVDGPALSALLREKGRLSEREALRLFIPLCEALEHANEQGVVHRDIKPANILVDAHGRARLVDLGLAFSEDDPLLTKSGGTLGTPHYLSPEQARNPGAVDVRSDIWSLGASMFHAMCGRPPFTGESVAEILSGVLYAHIPDPRELEPSLSQGMGLVLRKCLTRSTEKRYGSPSELLRDLEALRERRAVRVSVRNLDPMAGEADRRRRNLWIGAGVALALAVAAFTWWRPWAASIPEGETQDASRPAWAPLEAILAEAASDDRRAPGNALARLDELSDKEVPPEYKPDYWAARASVQSRFDSRIAEERKRIVRDYERAFSIDRDFVSAAALVSSQVETRLVRDLGANDRQRELVKDRLRFDELREQVESDEQTALDRFLKQVNVHYDSVVLPQARSAVASGAWLAALTLMQRDVREILNAAGISARGLTPAKVEERLASVRLLKVDSEADVITKTWQAKDAELERALLAHQQAIEVELRRRVLVEDAAAAINAAYAKELLRSSLRLDQMLLQVSDRSHAALERARAELSKLQEELLVTDAREELSAVDEQLDPLWRERKYSEVAATCSKRMDEDWLRPVHAQFEQLMGQAILLDGLLARAVRGLGQPGLDSILVGSIAHTGRIQLGVDPLRDGFKLAFGGKSEAFALREPRLDPQARLLVAGSIERLAGFSVDPKDEVSSIDRLVRALFRFREGDTDAALKAFNSGPLPRESHAALVTDLEARLNRAHGELSAKALEREQAAQVIYNLIQREKAHTREADRIKRITDLLNGFSDTAFVREHEVELRDLRASLATFVKLTPEEQLLKLYGSTFISFPRSERALLSYDCGSEALLRWSMGDWNRGIDGWSAGRKHSKAELEDGSLWPRLLLEDPLDLDAAMSVEIEWEQPQSSGPPQRFIVSVAGWHIGFAGPSEIGEKAQVASTAGGDSALLELLSLLDKNKGIPKAGLERGKLYKLRVELVQGRGNLSATLNGVKIQDQAQMRPEGKGGSNTIVLRSLEPVLLKAVRIEAGLGKK